MVAKFVWHHLSLLVLLLVSLTLSTPNLSSVEARAKNFTRPIEFDYVTWDLSALLVKLEQAGVQVQNLLPVDQRQLLVLRYFELVQELEEVSFQVEQAYIDPDAANAKEVIEAGNLRLTELRTALTGLTPLAESILQTQVEAILAEQGISRLGTAIPPVLFHTTPLPMALIVSPRDKIQQEVNISLLADLGLEDQVRLERQVENATASSALVVEVGGIGIYPTMVMRSANAPWVIDTVIHEWAHNYLTLRPLGLNYETSPELRTMNETTASIVGNELSLLLLERYYPHLLDSKANSRHTAAITAADEPFDFRAEMHMTRVTVDALLAEGKILEAEEYMEARRIVFVQNGYLIRKLNQAYFAFHGAYADQPGGAAGQDPVGPAVRALRERSASLADFLREISAMNAYSDLQTTLAD
jgi:hypothetical protein